MTDSAHRSPESAHRSGGRELKTEVFFVKTPQDQDAVIVSFVDEGENNGIFMYEPGAEPVEVDGVYVTGTANEFDYAEVTFSVAGSDETRDWPGDVMVSGADRDAAVERATEHLGNLQQAYDALRAQAEALVQAVERQHQDSSDGDHDRLNSFQWCRNPVCEAARGVEL